MRAVIQRVNAAAVDINKVSVGAIKQGLVVLLGIRSGDDHHDLRWLVDKIINLRIFDDEKGCMNLSLRDVDGEMLIISQFTLYADCRRGRRPSWNQAAPPEQARKLYDDFVASVQREGITVQTGQFQADMQVSLTNDGPVTIILDSPHNHQ